MKDINKDWKELDVNAVDFKNGSWSWGRGGGNLQDHEFSVSHISKDLVETNYKCPEWLNQMLRLQYRTGKEGAQANMRHCLGI